MELKIKRLTETAKIPQYKTLGAACFDLCADEDAEVWHYDGVRLISTGLAFEVPFGHVMLVYLRSGVSIKKPIALANHVGVVDSDYRGEVKIPVRLVSAVDVADYEPLTITKGERIAQAMIVPYVKAEIKEVEELSETKRGAGGFGSTGDK